MLSSIEAVKAASPSAPVATIATINRRMLWNGGIISIVVPPTAKEGEYPSPAGPQKFIKFPITVTGGVVNVFVHDEEPTRLLGQRISAAAEIWQKTLADGRKFLHVDLDPVPGPITHRVSVMSARKEDLIFQDGFAAFDTPMPLRGMVVAAPVDSKIRIKPRPTPGAEASRPTVETKRPPKPRTTGDRQLDRYLADGWKIDREDEKTVHLSKMRGDREVKLVHHRPRSGKKNHKH